jgi:hypothetical protein
VDELTAAAQSLLSVVLVAAGLAKLRDRDGFMASLRSYRWVPKGAAGALGWGVPVLECALAAALWVGPLRRPAALLATGLLMAFTVLIVRLVLDGGEVGCGCFGSSSQRVTWFSVIRNIALLAAAAIAVLSDGVEATAPAVLTGFGASLLIVVADLATSALAPGRRG